MYNEAASIFTSHVLPVLYLISAPVTAIIIWLLNHMNNKTVKALEEKIRLLTEYPLTLKNGIYYDSEGWPFCPICFGKENRRIPMQKGKPWKARNGGVVPARMSCGACQFLTDIPIE